MRKERVKLRAAGQVGPESRICTANLMPRSLIPGEGYVFQYTWRTLGTNGQRLPAAAYELIGIVFAPAPVVSPPITGSSC